MSTPKKTKAAVTAEEIATARQALEVLVLAPPAPAPETITLASGIQELAAQIRGLMKAGYPLEQIATCIKLGGIEMKAPKLRRYLALGDKRGTKTTRVKKPVQTTEPTQKQPQPTQQVAVQGTTPTPTAAQTRPTTNPSANPATATSALASPVVPSATMSRVVPPASVPAPTAAAHPAIPPAQPPSVPANAPMRSVPATPAIAQPVAVPSTIRPQNPASPVAPRTPTHASYPQASDANGRSASASRSGDMPTADQRFRDTALLRQTASNVRAQASGPVSAGQAAAQTQTGAPTVPPRNPDTLF